MSGFQLGLYSGFETHCSTSSSRTYGSRDRTFDFLADEDEDEDLFNDALDVSLKPVVSWNMP